MGDLFATEGNTPLLVTPVQGQYVTLHGLKRGDIAMWDGIVTLDLTPVERKVWSARLRALADMIEGEA